MFGKGDLMSWSTFFVQSCTTCGRKLQVQVVDLGKELVCQHCGGVFLAAEREKLASNNQDPANRWIELADQFLDADITEGQV